MPAGHAGEAELNQLLGERSAFSRVADSCSAADAACLRRMRDERMYRFKKVNWSRFCAEYLGISKAEADRIIRRFEEFGQSYFDVSRIVRISPESYRAIAHAVKDKTIEHNGESHRVDQRERPARHRRRAGPAPGGRAEARAEAGHRARPRGFRFASVSARSSGAPTRSRPNCARSARKPTAAAATARPSSAWPAICASACTTWKCWRHRARPGIGKSAKI